MQVSPGTSDVTLKVIMVGEIRTGKTSIIQRYVHKIFLNSTKPTLGVDFAQKSLEWGDDKTVNLQLWDIAGQERFGVLTRVYYKKAVGGFVVFDVTNPDSLSGAVKWKNDIDSKVLLPDGKPIPVVLLANKVDLLKGHTLDHSLLDRICQEHGFVGWFETSAATNKNLGASMNFLVAKVLDSGCDLHEAKDDDIVDPKPTEEEESTWKLPWTWNWRIC